MLDILANILASLAKLFPELLDALKPDHDITLRVREILPEESESARAARQLSGP